MRTFEHDCPSVSLVSWAQTAQPLRFGSSPRGQRQPLVDGDGARIDATDDVLFGFSAAALLVTPLALLVIVLFG